MIDHNNDKDNNRKGQEQSSEDKDSIDTLQTPTTESNESVCDEEKGVRVSVYYGTERVGECVAS